MAVKKALTLSIVIPAYNEENHLRGCLDSIVAQSVKPDEVIVVDNNSTDRTAKIARDHAFVKLVAEPRQGVLFARNTGFEAARSDIIARIDGDTRLEKDWIKHVKQGFEQYPNDALTGPVHYYDMPLPHWNKHIDHFFRSRIYRYYPQLPALFGTNMAMPRAAWRAVSNKVCTGRELFEDIDLAIHLSASGVHCRYYQPMLAGMSARRYDDRFRQFNNYLKLYDKTYHDHGYKSLMPRLTRAIYLVFYVIMKPMRRAYNDETGRRSLHQLWRGHRARKHPMEA